MTLRIAFDLDGVLANMDATVARETAEVLGHAAVTDRSAPASPPDTESEDQPGDSTADGARRLTRSEQRDVWKRMRRIDNFWESLDEIEPGIVARLWTLAQERRWDVVFLTSRPDANGHAVQLQTQRWLQRHGFLMPSACVVRGSRGKIAAALGLDIVIDDRPENCVDVVADSTAGAILILRKSDARIAASATSLGIRVLGSVAECLDVLISSDLPRPPAPKHVLADAIRS